MHTTVVPVEMAATVYIIAWSSVGTTPEENLIKGNHLGQRRGRGNRRGVRSDDMAITFANPTKMVESFRLGSLMIQPMGYVNPKNNIHHAIKTCYRL